MKRQRFEPLLAGESFALKRAISTRTMLGAHHRLIRAIERFWRVVWAP